MCYYFMKLIELEYRSQLPWMEQKYIGLPDYHCPGVTMLLIEGDTKNMLYTGDLRAES